MAQAKLSIDIETTKIENATRRLKELELAATRAKLALDILQGKSPPLASGGNIRIL